MQLCLALYILEIANPVGDGVLAWGSVSTPTLKNWWSVQLPWSAAALPTFV